MKSKDTLYSPLIDKDFVFELSKRGKVSITSSQITIEMGKGDGNFCELQIPPHTHLEYMYAKAGKHEDQEVAVLRFVCEIRKEPPPA